MNPITEQALIKAGIREKRKAAKPARTKNPSVEKALEEKKVEKTDNSNPK